MISRLRLYITIQDGHVLIGGKACSENYNLEWFQTATLKTAKNLVVHSPVGYTMRIVVRGTQ